MATTFRIGQRVGIVRGVQSVNGPHVYMFGTVVRTVTTWRNCPPEYVVRAEDGSELVYPAYLLRPVAARTHRPSERPETVTFLRNGVRHALRRSSGPASLPVREARCGRTATAATLVPMRPLSVTCAECRATTSVVVRSA